MRTLKLLQSIIKNRTGGVPHPSWCTYLVTYRCNARCKMCDSWQMPQGRELSVDEVDRLFADVGRLDVVRLSGGEPFLRRDLPELAEAVLRRSDPLALHVTTNGSLQERAAEFIRRFSRPHRLHLMVSLDGLADVHDASRGPAVTFDRTLETLRCLSAMRRVHGFKLSVNHTVISAASMAQSEELHRVLEPLGVDIQSVLAYADSSMYGRERSGTCSEDLVDSSGYPLHEDLGGADSVGFVDSLLQRSRRLRNPMLRWGKRYYLKGLRARLAAGGNGGNGHGGAGGKGNGAAKPRVRRQRCVALRSHLRLLPDGSVPVCQFNTETVGNLADASLESVWHGEAARRQRAWVDACPGCWAECEVIPNAIYSGQLLTRAL